MKKKSVKKNYIYNLMYQIMAIIAPIITTPYIARRLGPSGNGIYGYTISIVTYFILFGSLGINLYGQREIAYVQNDKKKRSKVFSELFILKTFTMTLSMIIFFFCFCIRGEYTLYFKILILELFANILDISWLYAGMEEFKTISIRNMVVKIISVTLMLTLIKNHTHVDRYVFIYTLTTLISSMILWFSVRDFVEFKYKGLNIRRHLKPNLSLFVPQIAIQVYVVLDKTMLGTILNDMNEVGYYEQSQKIIRILLTVITSVGTVMLPRIAKEFAQKNMKVINAYMKKTFNFVFLLAFPLIFGIVAVSKNFVPLFFGPGYDRVVPIMSLMSVIVVLIGLGNITGTQYLLPLKRQKEYTISVICGAVINVICNFALIWKLEAIGATIGTIVAELTVTSIQLYFVKDDFRLREIFKMAIKYLLAASFMFAICMITDRFIELNLTAMIAQVVVGITSYFGILILFRDRFVLSYVSLFQNKVKDFFRE